MNGSAGLVETGRPPGRYAAMGRLSSSMMSTRSSNSHPMIVPTRMAPRLQRMRQRSSSRWSRNGISPRAVILWELGAGGGARLRPEALLVLAREIGLGGPRISGDHTGVELPRRRSVAPLFGKAAQLV